MKLSTGLRNGLLSGNSLKALLDGGEIRVGGRKLRPGAYRLQSLDPSGATQHARFSIAWR